MPPYIEENAARTEQEQSGSAGKFRVNHESDDLYFFRIGHGDGPVKIGRSKNPRKRRDQVQGSCPYPVETLAVLPGKGFQEKAWHIAFEDIRMSGEWFESYRYLLRAIERAAAGERWWDNLTPPIRFASEAVDDDDWEEDVTDWQIALEIALAAPSTRQFAQALFPYLPPLERKGTPA